MSSQGISSADFTALETAKVADISGYIYALDTPPETIDIGVLPPNLQTKVQQCEGNDNCKLVSYDFIADTGENASSSPYLIQLTSTSGSADKSDVAVLAKIGDNPVTSLGIPTENLTSQYKSDRLQLTPPIVSGPIGYTALDSGYAISGIGTQVSGTSADACATQCSAADCQGFNFDESATQCNLFTLVDKEAIIRDPLGGGSNKIKTLMITLKDSITGLAVGQKIEGLSSYINDDTLKIKNVTSPTQIQLEFSEQIVGAIPANTPIRIKTPTDVSTLQAYASEKDHIKVIGVNGNETYGYNAIFKISAIVGLPTVTNGQVLMAAAAITEIVVPVNMTGINAVISTGVLPIAKTGSVCTSGVYSTNDVQTTACTCTDASIAESKCKIPLNVKSYTQTNITFQLPSNSTLPNGSASGSPLNLSAIEFTATLAVGSPVPHDRIIGWTGRIAQVSGSYIPVTVKSYTASTITFTFPAQSYGNISAQDVELSDTKGRSCQDIKACNASVQRLLDDSTVSSFSTNDLVACSGCNERAYKKPDSGTTNITNLRKYLWFENAGPYECTTVAPAGTVLDDKCNITCPTRSDGATTSYDSVSQECRVTCRTGFYWDSVTNNCISCPSVSLPTNITLQGDPMCKGTCVHATGTTPTNMQITPTLGSDISAIPNYLNACTVSCSSGVPNPTNTRCCPAVTTPTGTTITGYTDDCATPVCAKTDGTNDFIDTVTGASGPTCSYTCQPVTTNNGTTFSPITSDTPQTGVILPAKDSTLTTLTSVDPELVGTGDVQTNIGTYVFSPLGSRAAIYTGTGTPAPTPTYNLPGDGIISINFPFKIKIELIQFWKSTATSVNINLKNVQGGTDVLSQTLTFSSSTTFSSSQSAFGRFLTMTFSGGGTVAYKIKATIQKICTGVCNPPGGLTNGRVVLDSTRVCKIICNQGYTPNGTVCSSCPVATLDPGTSAIFNSADCGGSCYVFNPIIGNANSLRYASAYAGTTNTNSETFTADDTGTARVCHIKECPSDRTMYTTSISTTLNNSGCCPIPTIPTNSGITWSYPANGSTVVPPCNLTCTAPTTYGMTTTATQPTSTTGASCSRVCPTYLNPASFTISVNSETCQPTCSLATADGNGYADTSYSSGTVQCTKMCNPNHSKDSAVSKCCLTWTGGTNITITYGTSSTCPTTPCRVTVNPQEYATIEHNASNRTCSIKCKNRGTDQTQTIGSYSTDGQCSFSCSQFSLQPIPNGTANPATDINGNPYCVFGCSGNNYKSLGASKCCANITSDTGTIHNKRNDATCNFDCVLASDKSSVSYTSTAVGRTCVLGCKYPTLDSGTAVDTAPTLAGGCNDFTCKISDTTTYPSSKYTATKSGQRCVLGCVTPTTDNLSTVGVNTDCTFTCSSKVTNGLSEPAADGSRACTYKGCASGYTNINTGTPTSWMPVCCLPVSTPAGTKRSWNYDSSGNMLTCGFTCSLAAGYSTADWWTKPADDGSRACVLVSATYNAWSSWSACNAECCGLQKRTRSQTVGWAIGNVQTGTQRCNTDANNCLVRFYSGCDHNGSRSGTLLPGWSYDMPWGGTFINIPGYGPSTRSGGTIRQALDSSMTLPPNQAISTYMGVRNDDLLSLKIPSGVKVTVYQNNNFGGLWFTMSGNDPATKNRKFCNTDKWWADGGGRTSSVKVEFDTPAI